MNENAVKIQIAEKALEGLAVPATEENVGKLSVIWQMLQQVKEDLMRGEAAPAPGEAETIEIQAGP